MKLTILETGVVPEKIASDFPSYPEMFRAMFLRDGADWTYQTVRVNEGETLPAPQTLEAVLITGSAAGVYEDHDWLPPLREFIADAYAARLKMVGICFGHQVIAQALGGVVEKSDKGWGMGRHTYALNPIPPLFELPRASLSITCSHQDQVIVPPADAKVILSSEFTPYAGLLYDNGAVLTIQPHPEFEDDYARSLADLRRGRAPDAVVDTALASFSTPSDSALLARAISRFLQD